jgi:hypothetical protein
MLNCPFCNRPTFPRDDYEDACMPCGIMWGNAGIKAQWSRRIERWREVPVDVLVTIEEVPET